MSAPFTDWTTANALRSRKSPVLARTVVPYLYDEDTVRRGQRIGMIRLGSRVDLRVPAEAYISSIITAEDKHKEHPKGMHVMAGRSVVFEEKWRKKNERLAKNGACSVVVLIVSMPWFTTRPATLSTRRLLRVTSSVPVILNATRRVNSAWNFGTRT